MIMYVLRIVDNELRVTQRDQSWLLSTIHAKKFQFAMTINFFLADKIRPGLEPFINIMKIVVNSLCTVNILSEP